MRLTPPRRRRTPPRRRRTAPGSRPLPEAPAGGRRQPARTCLGCRGGAAKSSLLRIVRDGAGAVRFDPTGRAGGRGAYVHASEECVRRAIRGGTLARALRTGVDPGRAATLMRELMEVVGAQ